MPQDPIALPVAGFYQLGLDREFAPVSTEVRDQLGALLRSAPGPQTDALFEAVMTTVVNLELAIRDLTSTARAVYTKLLDLETRVIESGLQLGPSAYPERIEFST